MFQPFDHPERGAHAEYYCGKPKDTIYSTHDFYRRSYDDIRHRVESGKLIDIFFDYEASDKIASFAEPKEFAALAFDLQGRLLGRLRMPIAMPEYQAYAIGAALVGRIPVANLDKGWPGHMAAAMVQGFFRRMTRLDGEALELEETEFADGKKGYSYPVLEGEAPLELHNMGQRFRFAGEEKWRKLYALSQPFNGENYDDPMASHWFSRLGFAHLFPTAQKRHDTYREDMRAKAIWEWAFGVQGKYGLHLPDRWHRKTRRSVLSTRLGDILLANSVPANRARGVDNGIVYHDGRYPDPEVLHASEEDAAGTAALSFYLNRLDPAGMRFLSQIGDTEKHKNFLQADREFGDRPLRGFVHYDEGMLTRGIGMLLSTDDEYGDRRRALMFNLAHDPADYQNLDHEKLRPLLVQRHHPVFVQMVMNRTAQVAEFQRAYEAGAGGDISPEVYHQRRQKLLSNDAFMRRVMETWFDLTTPSRPPNIVTARDMEEDSYAHYGDLKYPVYRDPVTGKKRVIPKDIYARATDKWDFVRKFDTLIRRATEGHAVEYSDAEEAVGDYNDRLKDIEKKLDKLQAGWASPFYLPDVGISPTTPEEARQHLWLMRHACRAVVYNCLPEFWVANGRRQRLPWEKVIAMQDRTRIHQWPLREDRVKDERLYITFERNPKRQPIITALRVFDADAFNRTHGSPEWQKWWAAFVEKNYAEWRPFYDAYVTLGVQGAPNLDPSRHKRMSEARAVQEIEHMLGRAAEGPNSDYVRQVLKTPMGQKMLAEHRAYKEKRLAQHEWTPEKMELMGYDPDTRFPFSNPRFHINPAAALTIRVPDVMLEQPGWDDHWHQFHVIEQPVRAVREALAHANKEKRPLILEGEATGMFRLAAEAVCQRVPDAGERTRQALTRARGHYSTIGKKLSENIDKLSLLTFEQLVPIHGADPSLEGKQSLSLPALDWAGLVDARAGGLPAPLDPITGILVRDTGQDIAPGDVRLRRVLQGEETGDEYRGIIARAERIHVDDLVRMSEEEVQKFGKFTAPDLYSYWKKLFADLRVTDASRQTLWRITLAAPVDKKSYCYEQPVELPTAMFKAPRPAFIPPRPKPHRAAA